MKLSLKKIFNEVADLERWSDQIELDDEKITSPRELQQRQQRKATVGQTDVGKIWGGVSLPDMPSLRPSDKKEYAPPEVERPVKSNQQPKYWADVDKTMGTSLEDIIVFIDKIKNSGRELNQRDVAYLRSVAPGGDIENLMGELDQYEDQAYKDLIALGIEDVLEKSATEFPKHPQTKLPFGAPTKRKQILGQQASWEDLIRQNPNFDKMRPKQRQIFTRSGGRFLDAPDETKKLAQNK